MTTPTYARLFGTDGIRGRAGEFPLDPATITAIGRALGELLDGSIIIGRDPRESSPWIFEPLREGVESGRTTVLDAGILPTPAIALLTGRSGAAGGVMISASHNSFEDNGIKVFGANGQKLDDRDEARVEERVWELLAAPRPSGSSRAASGRGGPSPDYAAEYMAILRAGFPQGRWLTGFRIGVDCANGATSQVAPRLFESLGATVHAIHANPDGRNINAGCGAVHPDSLVEWVRKNPVDLGVAYDGDGDRSMFVTGSGRLIDGDGVLLVMARALRKQGRLNPPVVVGTSMTNFALEQILSREGIRVLRVDVGDRFVFRKMLDEGVRLGGEPSGHVIFPDFRLSGDGLLTTLKLCETMIAGDASLEELTRDWVPAPQILLNVPVAERIPLDSLPEVTFKIKYISDLLKDRGRIVVRYSGTEPLLRIMIESDSAQTNEALAGELAEAVRRAMPPDPDASRPPGAAPTAADGSPEFRGSGS